MEITTLKEKNNTFLHPKYTYIVQKQVGKDLASDHTGRQHQRWRL